MEPGQAGRRNGKLYSTHLHLDSRTHTCWRRLDKPTVLVPFLLLWLGYSCGIVVLEGQSHDGRGKVWWLEQGLMAPFLNHKKPQESRERERERTENSRSLENLRAYPW